MTAPQDRGLVYTPRQRLWDSMDVLAGATWSSASESGRRHQRALEEFEPVLWNDLTSEHDSHVLTEILRSGWSAYSPAFRAFVTPWAHDEYNHYVGFRQIYSAFYGESITSIAARVERRKSDLSSIEAFLEDEFKLLLLLAYDEIVTSYAYHRDIPFYRSLGVEPFHKYIRLVSGDEGMHFDNVIRLIKATHAHRLGEARDILWGIVRLDKEGTSYEGTFVMDHKLPYPLFPLTEEELLHKCAGRTLELLTGSRSFT